MARDRVDPLWNNSRISTQEGTPTPEFMRNWNALTSFNNDATAQINALAAEVARLGTSNVLAGPGISVTVEPTGTRVGLATVFGIDGTYGDATNVPQITVDQYGRVIEATNVPVVTGVNVEDEGTPVANANTLNFTGSGVTVTDAGGGLVTVDITGGGGGNAFVAGATGDLAAASSSSNAIKGMVFTPDVDMEVTAIVAFIDASAVGQSHDAFIASLNNSSPTAEVVAVLGTATTQNTVATDMVAYRFVFSTPVALTAGTAYLFAVRNASGTGTTAMRVGSSGGSASNAWRFNAPGAHPRAPAFVYNLTSIGAGQAPTSTPSDDNYFTIYPEVVVDGGGGGGGGLDHAEIMKRVSLGF